MIETNSQKFLRRRSVAPVASSRMAKSVSEYRRATLDEEVASGKYQEAGVSGMNYNSSEKYGATEASNVVSSSIKKYGAGAADGGGFRGSGGTLHQVPEIYSPLWLTSNLNLPRDRATINSWCRSFYALNPIVQNAISLHSTYPISKLSLKCPNEKVLKFFEEMNEEIELMNICTQIAQEYWTLGEAIVYAELDKNSSKWSRLLIQNPDYIVIKHSVVAGEPTISLRPDENLQRIVKSNRPSDIQQRRKLDKNIIEHVRRGENIPLSNFHASHIARKISPYEIRGTGLPVCCFRQLMLFDLLREAKFAQAYNMINPLTLVKIGDENYKPSPTDLEAWREVFECHDEETEVLTNHGFRKFNEVIEYCKPEGSNTYETKTIAGYKIACFNSETEGLEYHIPSAAHVHDYDGEMYHFEGKQVDIKVTPNHDMFVSRCSNNKYLDWQKIKAQDISNSKYKLRNSVKWNGIEKKTININDVEIDTNLYLKILGYVISDGHLAKRYISQTSDDCKYIQVCISQQTKSKHYAEMRETIEKFASNINCNVNTCIKESNAGFSASTDNEMWLGTICNTKFAEHIFNEISTEGKATSFYKKVPRWIFDLTTEQIKIFLDALISGDGSICKVKDGNSYRYFTVSKQLAQDVNELVFKCGYSAFISTEENKVKNGDGNYYVVRWSDSGVGQNPTLYNNPDHKCAKINKEQYKGKVWCFTVPTGLFVTRRNGRITIQGNSAQYDKDFKIFTHQAVTVEKIGSNAAIIDTQNDIVQLLKEMYSGLLVPQVLMDGGGDVTYANGGVTLDVLRQRYMQFRNELALWLRRRIFAPISKINEFYDYENGKKTLIVPEVEWNHMSLFDTTDYITALTGLTQGDDKKASVQTLYKSLGLDWEDEKRKIREEAVFSAIIVKEKVAMEAMPLSELRTIGPNDEIKEVPGKPLPGEAPAEGGEEMGGLPGMEMPGGGADMGGMPEAPPPV